MAAALDGNAAPNICRNFRPAGTAAQQAINVGTFYRASDHDPVLVGLSLTPPSITYAGWSATIAWPNGSDASPSGDVDHDGASNLEELMTGRNPLVSDTALSPVANTTAGVLQYDYRFKQTVTGKSVVPQWSTDLIHWSDLSAGSVLNEIDPTLQLRRVHLSLPAQTRAFVRLDLR